MIINFSSAIDNSSVAVGDIAYASSVSSIRNGLQYFGEGGATPNRVGRIISVGSNFIEVESDSLSPVEGDFIMFSKDNSVNAASLKGYYASITMKNESTDRAELFAVNAVVHESSK